MDGKHGTAADPGLHAGGTGRVLGPHRTHLARLLDVVADRAPSLCNREALLPLARLATWTDSEAWVRPLDEWPGEAATAAASGMDEDDDGVVE